MPKAALGQIILWLQKNRAILRKPTKSNIFELVKTLIFWNKNDNLIAPKQVYHKSSFYEIRVQPERLLLYELDFFKEMPQSIFSSAAPSQGRTEWILFLSQLEVSSIEFLE